MSGAEAPPPDNPRIEADPTRREPADEGGTLSGRKPLLAAGREAAMEPGFAYVEDVVKRLGGDDAERIEVTRKDDMPAVTEALTS